MVHRYGKAMLKLCDYTDDADDATVMDNSGARPFPVFLKDGDDMRLLKDPETVPWVEQSLARRYPLADHILNGPFG